MKRLVTAVLIGILFLSGALLIWSRLFQRTDTAAEMILFAYEDEGQASLQGISPSGSKRVPLVLTNPTTAWVDELSQRTPFSARTVSALNIEHLVPHSPSWSAGGSLITYQNYRYDRACDEMVLIGSSQKEPQAVACLRLTNPKEMLDWGADGQHIAFTLRESNVSIIQVLDATGEQTNRFFPGDKVWGLAWSPDGAQIAATLATTPTLRIYPLDGNVIDLQPEAPAFGKPTWSPDGSALAFFCYAQERIDICVQPVDGTQGVRISFPPEFPYLKYQLQWSPDGSRLLFVGQQRGGQEDLFVVAPDGSNLRQLTTHPASDLEPAWSPDGQHIVFVSTRDGNKELYTIAADGTDLTRLTATPGNETEPSWKPQTP